MHIDWADVWSTFLGERVSGTVYIDSYDEKSAYVVINAQSPSVCSQ